MRHRTNERQNVCQSPGTLILQEMAADDGEESDQTTACCPLGMKGKTPLRNQLQPLHSNLCCYREPSQGTQVNPGLQSNSESHSAWKLPQSAQLRCLTEL